MLNPLVIAISLFLAGYITARYALVTTAAEASRLAWRNGVFVSTQYKLLIERKELGKALLYSLQSTCSSSFRLSGSLHAKRDRNHGYLGLSPPGSSYDDEGVSKT